MGLVFFFFLFADYAQEQEMELEALEAILMDDFKGILFAHISIDR